MVSFPSSCLPDLLPSIFHHVCLVLLEDHLHQTFKPHQRGIYWPNQALWNSSPRTAFQTFSFLSSSACPRLTRSATRRRRGRSRNKRSCGGLPTLCPCTPAQEPEVCAAHVSHIAPDGVISWPYSCCVTVAQQSATVTGAKSSSQTGVITAPHVTCKKSFFIMFIFLSHTTVQQPFINNFPPKKGSAPHIAAYLATS